MRPALRSSRSERRRETPGSQYAGGHRIRVTPVPIPNTEVKPDTADGTAWETVWESRSLPAVIQRKTPEAMDRRLGRFSLIMAATSATQFPMQCHRRPKPPRLARSASVSKALHGKPAWESRSLPRTDLTTAHRQPASTPRSGRSEEHTSELQSHSDLVCRLLLEKKNKRDES